MQQVHVELAKFKMMNMNMMTSVLSMDEEMSTMPH